MTSHPTKPTERGRQWHRKFERCRNIKLYAQRLLRIATWMEKRLINNVPRLTAIMLLMSTICSFAQPALTLTPRLVAFAPAPQPAFSSGVLTASWTPSPSPDVVAYRLAWGTNLLNNSTQVGKGITNITLKGLIELANYTVAISSVSSNGVESVQVSTNAVTQPTWRTFNYVTAFTTLLQAGRTNIVQSSTNGGVAWRNLITNTVGGVVTLLRTNGVGVAELFRVK